MLGILGDAAGDAATRRSGLEPMPGLERLGELSRRSAPPGCRSSWRWSGAPRPLDAGIELSAYRIVQEALTNALKHARGARARVRARATTADALEIEVVDAGGRRCGAVRGRRGRRSATVEAVARAAA